MPEIIISLTEWRERVMALTVDERKQLVGLPPATQREILFDLPDTPARKARLAELRE